MDIVISGEALGGAKNCPKKFSCLTGEKNNLCPVDECTAGNILFINCLYNKYCPYRERFADGFISCICPVRREIYEKYGI